MKNSFLSKLLCVVLAVNVIAGAQTDAPQLPAAQKVEHPLFRTQLYPAWSAITPKQAMIDTEAAMRIALQQFDAICRLTPEEMTFENTFLAYGEAVAELEQTQQYLHHIVAVTGDPAIQQVQSYLMGALTQFDAQLMQNERLWWVIKTASEQPWVQHLAPEQKLIVDQTVLHFKHSGADLSPEGKKRKAEINLQLGQLAMKYGRNVQDASAEWYLLITNPDELRGLPPARMAVAEAEARARGFSTPENPAWLITINSGLAQDVVATCNVAETRRKCWYGLKCPGAGTKYDNAPVIAAIMALRQEYAQLIGYQNYADMKAATRMMKSGQAALDFVDGMMSELKPAFDKENAMLLEYMSQLMNEPVTQINPWDERKYASMMAGAHYAFNTASVRPYFEKERVVQGLFSLCGNLFGVTFSEVPTAYVTRGQQPPADCAEVWHPDVKLYAVHDTATGQHLGSFYLDLHPRKGKRNGAWCMPLRMGDAQEPHLAALVANFGTAAPGQPVLFSHPELQIFFHEFGHMMHYMLGRARYRRHCSPAVAWDFAEMPSLLLENWAWEPAVLATFAFHYETGEPIPPEYLQKLADSRHFMPATNHMRSLCVAKLDLEMHMHYAEKFAGKDLDAAAAEMLAPYTAPFSVQVPCIMRNLLHCFQGGYAAGYYTYKWSETLAADAYSRFRKEGIFNPQTGAEYRKVILEPGASRPADVIFREFIGRDVNPEALFESQGLK